MWRRAVRGCDGVASGGGGDTPVVGCHEGTVISGGDGGFSLNDQAIPAAPETVGADDSDQPQSLVCRFCLGGADDGHLLAPCRCIGTHKHVHRDCLLKWLRTVESRGGDPLVCELCRHSYTGLAAVLGRGWRWRRLAARTAAPCAVLAVMVLVSPILSVVLFLFLIMQPRREVLVLVTIVALIVSGQMGFRLAWGNNGLRLILTGDTVPALEPGVVLCFRPKGAFAGRGPFASSVVLLTEYSHWGAKGYIVNKPREVTAHELSNLAKGDDGHLSDSINDALSSGKLRMGFGGPVPFGWEALHTNGSVPDAALTGVDGLWIGGRWREVLRSVGNPFFLRQLMRGYAGWAPGQLDGEVRRGAWTIHKVAMDVICDTPPDDLYDVVSAMPAETTDG